MPNKPKTKSADTTVTVMNWGGAPIQCAQWMVQLGVDHATELDASCKTLLKLGVDTGRYGLPQHYNKTHFLARQACISAGRSPMYCFENPPPGQAFWTQRQKDLSDALAAALAPKHDSSKHAAMTITVSIPLSTAPAGNPFHGKPAPISVTVKGDHVHVLTSDESKLGSIAPDALFKVSADIDDWLLSRLTSDSLRRQYRTQSDGCGLLLVRVFLTKVAVYAVAHGDAFETQLLSHVRRGIQSLSSEAYLHFKSFVEIYNAALPTDRIRSDSQIASILEEAAKGLGDRVRQEVRTNILIEHASGNLEKTHEQITLAIGREETEETQNQMMGEHFNAFLARHDTGASRRDEKDPNRPRH